MESFGVGTTKFRDQCVIANGHEENVKSKC